MPCLVRIMPVGGARGSNLDVKILGKNPTVFNLDTRDSVPTAPTHLEPKWLRIILCFLSFIVIGCGFLHYHSSSWCLVSAPETFKLQSVSETARFFESLPHLKSPRILRRFLTLARDFLRQKLPANSKHIAVSRSQKCSSLPPESCNAGAVRPNDF